MPTGLKLCGPFVVFHGAVEVACFAEKISAFVEIAPSLDVSSAARP